MSLKFDLCGHLLIFEILLENKHMNTTNDDNNMTGNADNGANLRTKSGQPVAGTVHASIGFHNRDEAIACLCQKVFGATPFYRDSAPPPLYYLDKDGRPHRIDEAPPRGMYFDMHGPHWVDAPEQTAESPTPDGSAMDSEPLAERIRKHLEIQFPATVGHIPLKQMLQQVYDMQEELSEEISERSDLERQLAEVTKQRDALVEALGKMLSVFNIMGSSEERDVWESAHSLWFMMKGGAE